MGLLGVPMGWDGMGWDGMGMGWDGDGDTDRKSDRSAGLYIIY